MDELSDERALSSAIKIASASVLPMVLASAIQLDLLHLIQTSHSASASASELASRLPTTNPQAPAMIDRILRLLAASSLLKCTSGAERRYSLTPVCKYFTRNEDGVSLAPLCLLLQDRVFMESWYHLNDAVVEGGVAFDRAHGVNAFQYQAKDPRFNRVFNEAMYEQSTIFMGRILEIYKGFEGVNSVVDVGGGTGASLKMIMSKYPCLKAINFDLPHVIRDAPSLPGVEHVGGDMFVSVPKAEAIFMKWICHDWSDAHCHKLLKNCYEALPENGKVIIAEATLPDDPNSWAGSSNSITGDLIMLSVNPGGKERTKKEFQALAENAGFNQIIQVCRAFNIWIMEFHKSTT